MKFISTLPLILMILNSFDDFYDQESAPKKVATHHSLSGSHRHRHSTQKKTEKARDDYGSIASALRKITKMRKHRLHSEPKQQKHTEIKKETKKVKSTLTSYKAPKKIVKHYIPENKNAHTHVNTESKKNTIKHDIIIKKQISKVHTNHTTNNLIKTESKKITNMRKLETKHSTYHKNQSETPKMKTISKSTIENDADFDLTTEPKFIMPKPKIQHKPKTISKSEFINKAYQKLNKYNTKEHSLIQSLKKIKSKLHNSHSNKNNNANRPPVTLIKNSDQMDKGEDFFYGQIGANSRHVQKHHLKAPDVTTASEGKVDVERNHGNTYKNTDKGSYLKISTDTNTETHINLAAHAGVYEDLLKDGKGNPADSLPDVGTTPTPEDRPKPQGEKEVNPYENSADHPADSNVSPSNKPDQKLDMFHVIYKIDGKEFEDKIPSDITMRIYDTDFRRQGLYGQWMANIHSAVVSIEFSSEDKRKFDLSLNNELECEDQDYIIDDKLLKLGANSKCIVDLIQENYKRGNPMDRQSYIAFIKESLQGYLNEQENELKIQVGQDEYIVFYKITDDEGNGVGDSTHDSPDAAVARSKRQQDKRLKRANLIGQEMMSPEGSDGSTINVVTGNQAQSMTQMKKCDAAREKYSALNFKQMSNKQYHEFKTHCSYLTKQQRYMQIMSNISTVRTSNCGHEFYSDLEWQLQKAINKLRMMYSATPVPALEFDYTVSRVGYLVSFDQFHEDRFTNDVFSIVKPTLDQMYPRVNKISLVLNKLEGPDCGFRMAKKIVKKIVECEKYKEMLFDNYDIFGLGVYVDKTHNKLWLSLMFANRNTQQLYQ